VQQYVVSMHNTDVVLPRTLSTTSLLRGVPLFTSTYDFWMESFQWWAFVNSPTSGTQYWDVALNKVVNATATGVVSTTTNGDTAAQFQKHENAINALLGTTMEELEVTVTRVSTAGSLYIQGAVVGRLVG
jgi:hypothetical protein